MATEKEGAPSPLPEMSRPEVPGKQPLAAEIEAVVAAMEKPKPKGMRRVKEEPKKEEPEPEQESKQEVEKPAEPKPEPVTQERLSSGFAKLERQRKAVAREEARIKAELEKLEAAKQEYEKNTGSRASELDKRQAEIDELLKLLDEDADKFVDALARRKNLKKDDIYDRWTRQRLNGGAPAAEDLIHKSNSETEKLRKELEELKQAQKAKEDEAKKQAEEAQKRQEYERAVAAENAGFIKHVKESGKYPLLAKETDEDIIKYGRYAAGNNPVGYAEIAAYLEEQLSFQTWKEAQQKPETPKQESAPAPEGKKAEPEKAKTITNQMTARRSVQAESTPLNDNKRLEYAIKSAWPDKR